MTLLDDFEYPLYGVMENVFDWDSCVIGLPHSLYREYGYWSPHENDDSVLWEWL